MIGWKPEEDDKLRQVYGKTSREELENLFGRKKQAIWLRAKKLGLIKVSGRVSGRHRWSTAELEKLYQMTMVMSSPKELALAFPGMGMDEIIIEAEKTGCDICYLKNREVLKRSVDVIIDIDLTLNLKTVAIKMGG
jgi:hypothetical protein